MVLVASEALICAPFPFLYSEEMKQEVPGFDPWVGKIPWRREWQCTPEFLPGKSQGQGSLEEPGRLQSMGSQRVRHD